MLEDNALVTRIVSRFHIIVTVVIALVGAAIFGAAAGGGEFFDIYVGLFVAGFIAVMLALGDKYWMVIPFAFTSQLPAIPIKGRMLDLPEIVAVLASSVFLLRYAVKRQTFSFFRMQHAPFLLYTGWAVFIFILNPVGLIDAGASLGGARFYAKILLALAVFIVMANQEITDKDCKWIFILLLTGSCLETVYRIVAYLGLFGLSTNISMGSDPDDYYSWHQAIGGVPLILICLGFARFKASELFSLNRLWAVALFGICVILILLSGKRAGVAAIPLYAITAAFLRREWGFLMLWITCGIIAASAIIVGHGEFFRLPLTAQRALSVLPARWDSEFQGMEGGQDLFRAELRRMALKKIEKDPWIGAGYQVNLSLSQTLALQYATRGGDTELQATPFAMGSAWHNTWLGYAADFGIPASIFAAVIYFTVIRSSYGLAFRFPHGSMRGTLAAFLFLTNVVRLLNSHTSGHSAEDAFERWWTYGALVSLWIFYKKSLLENPSGGNPLTVEPSSRWGGNLMPAHSRPGSRPIGARAGSLVGGNSTH